MSEAGTGDRVQGTRPFVTDADVRHALPAALAHLRAGRLLAHPTETVYGIGSAIDEPALRMLAALKQRDESKPFVLLVTGRSMLGKIAAPLSRHAAALADRFWPGALTLVLLPLGGLPSIALGPSRGVAVRWTSHSGMQRLVGAFGAPLSSTSANVAGLPPARTAQEIETQWPREIGAGDLLVLDGGRSPSEVPSSIVDCTTPVPRIIRVGAVSAEELCDAVPELAGA